MQDRLLLGWLRSTMTGAVLSQHVQCQTAGSLWQALHRVYSAVSSTKIMELRRLLQITTRGDQGCNDYFEQMRNIADQLAAIGELLNDSDLIRYVLNGLGSEFNSFVVALTTRSNLVSLEELHGFLLSHESLLLSQHQIPFAESVALYASSSRGRGRLSRGCGRSFPLSQAPPLLPTPSPGRGGPFSSSLFSRGGASSFNPGPIGSAAFSHGKGCGINFYQPTGEKPVCQVCKKRGHAALDCWYRFYNNVYPSPPQAFLNTTTSTPQGGWFLDFRASHHVTSDVNCEQSHLLQCL
jgi:gag-polypeptide of LTR copia-type